MSQGDIQTLFGILNENLREGVTEESAPITTSEGIVSLFFQITVSIFMDYVFYIMCGT